MLDPTAAIARILDACDQTRGEHWITFLVTGPHGLAEKATVQLVTPEVQLPDETHIPYLRCQLAAINRVRMVQQVEHWRIRYFDAHPCAWSDSVDRYNDEVHRSKTP